MTTAISQTLLYSSFAACAMFGGALIATIRSPGEKLTNLVQHFAAGVVFAAVALELLPKLSEVKAPLEITIGFLIGVGLMLMLRKVLEEWQERTSDASTQFPASMVVAVAVDLFIDGTLIGISFIAGERGGILIAIALAIEVLFLGVATSSSLLKRKISIFNTVAVNFGLALLVVIGAVLGATVFSALPHHWLEAVLAFGVAALLYLVTEELLLEAHEVAETPLITSAFFIGFLIIFIIESQL